MGKHDKKFEPLLTEQSKKKCQKLYDELVQWGRAEFGDMSRLAGIIGSIINSNNGIYFPKCICDMEKEKEKLKAVQFAYWELLALLEDLLGIVPDKFQQGIREINGF